jgi:hypothetical protein
MRELLCLLMSWQGRVTISFILTFSLTDFTLTISQTDHTEAKIAVDTVWQLC